jgi:hypothetical protein
MQSIIVFEHKALNDRKMLLVSGLPGVQYLELQKIQILKLFKNIS